MIGILGARPAEAGLTSRSRSQRSRSSTKTNPLPQTQTGTDATGLLDLAKASRATGLGRRAARHRRAAAQAAAGCNTPPPRGWQRGAPPNRPALHRPQHRSRLLTQIALLSTACLAGLLIGSRHGARTTGQLAAAAASGETSSPTTPAVAIGASASGSEHGNLRLSVVAPLQQQSPFGVSWREVLEHTAQRLSWTDPAFQLSLHDAAAALEAPKDNPGDASSLMALLASLQGSQAVVAVGITDEKVAEALAPLLAAAPTAVALGSAQPLQRAARLGGRQIGSSDVSGGPAGLLQRLLPDKQAKTDQQVLHTVAELYQRTSSDDFLFIFLVLANAYIREVPAVAMSFKQKNAGLSELQCMIGNCGGQVFRCTTDTTCKTALNCLSGCEFNDQVCSYRCITSYESKLLEDFSLCIIQKHNCFGLSAEIPMVPDPAPMASWGGQPLTHALAEDLFIGWLEGDPSTSLGNKREGDTKLFSWRVFAGKNAAYDFFPCQFQLFYRGKGRGGMWYDPAFQVKTLDGRTVWRRRHYRVKRDKKPGTFRFSVLDNGVTSSEFWRILDCDEGLDWCVFYYSGAASRAGLNYSGAILASKSGDWPASQEARQRIERVLDTAGIKPWELSSVDNSNCAGAPLDPGLMALA